MKIVLHAMGKQRDIKALFNKVDLNGRAQLVWLHGTFEVSREYYGNKVSLYCLPGFHVEVVYSPVHNRIVRVESITVNKDLNKYLPFIDLKFA